ncbi:MAG TPA: beta-ketoacyl synthase N-terminal-like domain-containing protein, partial [Verrucomicrobiae bacterium]|nr:beta-ketoacyl synthase N-terminal-like domain-containing protein [Verrucomicrobiae bacterium]
MTSKPLVAGVGMTRFYKPSQSPTWDALGAAAVRAALTDAGLDYCDVQQAYAGYVFANTTSAQTTLYQVGLTGIPIVSVNNACASGSTALYLARQAVESGAVDVALALGFDQMPSGAIAAPNHIPAAHADLMADARLSLQPTDPDAPIAAQLFGGAGREYQQLYGTDAATFAQLQVKARRHAANNPLALFTAPLTVDEILQSPPLYGPLTRLQACPPTCGAAAALIVSPALARRRGLTGLIEIVAQTMTSDTPDAVEHPSMIDIVGADMTRRAADKVY